MGTRAVIYTRVSSDPRGYARSVGEQEAECRATCEREGWTVERVFTDNDRSASRFATKGRPEFRRLLAAVDAGECDVVVTWESSRMQRDLAVFVELRAAMLARGVLWHYGGRTFDMSRSRDRKETARDATDAEGASDETSERVQRSVRANAEKGRPHGRLLYGYRREYDIASGALVAQVEDPEQAAVIREVARRVRAGEALYAVAKGLNARGIPSPRGGTWEATQVRRLCVNPGYVGERVHRGKVVGTAAWPPILDEATHRACVARLTDPARRTNVGRGARHLLTGLARCGVCDGPMSVQKNRGYDAYLCREGFHVSRKEAWLDGHVAAVVVGRLMLPDLLDLLDDEDDPQAQAGREEAVEKRARLDGFYDAAAAGELTPAALSRIEARLLPEIEGAQKRGRPRSLSTAVVDIAGPDAVEHWPTRSLEQQREIVDLLCVVRVLPARRGARTFDPGTVEITWKTP